jgi:hypothetical protein
MAPAVPFEAIPAGFTSKGSWQTYMRKIEKQIHFLVGSFVKVGRDEGRELKVEEA